MSVAARLGLRLPEKLRGGRVEKYAEYWKRVGRDYAEAVAEVGRGAKRRPRKAALLSSLGLSALYMNGHNPDERNFRERFVRLTLDLMLVSDGMRSSASDERRRLLSQCYNRDLLRRWNLGLFSVIWIDNEAAETGSYLSQCKYLKVGYLNLWERVVDVGFLDRWWITEKKLEDFDVSSEEWDEKGSPRDPQGQLKQMW